MTTTKVACVRDCFGAYSPYQAASAYNKEGAVTPGFFVVACAGGGSYGDDRNYGSLQNSPTLKTKDPAPSCKALITYVLGGPPTQ